MIKPTSNELLRKIVARVGEPKAIHLVSHALERGLTICDLTNPQLRAPSSSSAWANALFALRSPNIRASSLNRADRLA